MMADQNRRSPDDQAQLLAAARSRYAAAAVQVSDGGQSSCCGQSVEVDSAFRAGLYPAKITDELPEHAVVASLGCGNPLAVAELGDGERVLDLGSGGGIDVLLSAQRVGPTGFVDGLDMTDEAERGSYAGCIAAALSHSEYLAGLAAAGFVDADLSVNYEVVPGMHAAIVRARKPSGEPATSSCCTSDDPALCECRCTTA